MRRLFYDLETSPNIGLFWKAGYKQRIDYQNIIKERAVICIAYRWQGDKDTHVLSWDKNQCDKSMLQKFVKILASSDECVGHNIDRFDWPWVKTRCLKHGISVPPTKTADSLQWARRYYYFNSNRLDYIATFLGIGCKVKTEFALWKDVLLDRNKDALGKMKQYCKWDVVLLEKVWAKLQVLCPVKTHAGVLNGNEKWSCPRCASENVLKWKRCITAAGTEQHKFKCKDCGSYFRVSKTATKAYEERST